MKLETERRLRALDADKVSGPASSTDNAVARFNLTTGKLIQDSAVFADDSGNLGVNQPTPATAANTTFVHVGKGDLSTVNNEGRVRSQSGNAAGGARAWDAYTSNSDYAFKIEDTTNTNYGISITFANGTATAGAFSPITDAAQDLGIDGSKRWRNGYLSGLPIVTSGSVFRKNAIINGNMSVAQRGTSFTSATTFPNNDDAYTLDRWCLLADGNDTVDVTQETSTVPTNGLYAMALDVETVNRKFGIAQFIEQKNCIGLIGETVTLSFKAKVSATTKLDNVKAAIIAWDGTADSVTSDIISAWGTEGANPTLATNWTYENTPANLSVTTSYATYSVSAAIDTSGAKNIGIFIWSDVTDTTLGDFLYITDVQLEKSSVATALEYRTYQVELVLARRYFEVISAATNGLAAYGIAQCASTSRAILSLPFQVEKRANPTTTLSATSDWAFFNQTIASYVVWSSFSPNAALWGAIIDVTTTTAGLGGAGDATIATPNAATTNARIFFNSEL